MDTNLIIYGFIALVLGFFLAFCISLYAIARLRKFEQSTSDIDWASLADLVLDVSKLKRNATKYQANVNAAQKLTQKEKLAVAIQEAQLRQQPAPMIYNGTEN